MRWVAGASGLTLTARRRTLGSFFQDIRYSVRTLIKEPVFTLVVAATLAIGIGSNITIFSVVYTVLLNPLSLKNSARLVMIWKNNPMFKLDRASASLPEFLDWRERSHVFEDLGAYLGTSFNLTGDGAPERVRGELVTASFFSTLEVTSAIGRLFTPEENEPGRNNVVVLSDGLWRRRYGGSAEIVGSTIILDDKAYTVLGVMPPSFKFPKKDSELWVPVPFDEANLNRGLQSFRVIARLPPKVTLLQAGIEMSAVAQSLEQEYPLTNSGVVASVFLLREELIRKIKPALQILSAAVGILLLVSCANVVNLLLFRTGVREKELAIRAALGASRARIIRQLLTDSLLLGGLGGGLGFLLSRWTLVLIPTLLPADLPRVDEVSAGGWILIFTLAVSLLTGAGCGLLSAKQTSRHDVSELFKAQYHASAVRRQNRRTQSILLVSQVALSVILIIAAALLIQSFRRLWNTNPGFQADNLLTAQISLPLLRYPEPNQQALFCRRLIEEVSPLPGVESVSVASSLPILGVEEYGFSIEGRSVAPGSEMSVASRQSVSQDYFRAMGIPLVLGRAFSDSDAGAKSNVVMINETMARCYWSGEVPLGKGIKLSSADSNAPWMSIIGVVGDVRQSGLDTPPAPEIYLPFFREPSSDVLLLVRVVSNPMNLARPVQRAVLTVDKDQPVTMIKNMEDVLAESVAQPRLVMLLITVFAVLAYILAAVGIYGLVSYSLSQRTQEIGIRIALGARPRDVLRLVLVQGLFLALAGIGVGLFASFFLFHPLSGLLYGVSAHDPATFIAAPLLVIAIALLATYIPARHASKLHPMIAMRHQ